MKSLPTFDLTTAIPVLVTLARLCCRSISCITLGSPPSTDLLSTLELDFSSERCPFEPFVELYLTKMLSVIY